MSGVTDLAVLIASMQPNARDEPYVMVTCPAGRPWPHADVSFAAMIDELAEGVTYVITRADADRLGLAYDFVAGWITLTVHSALEAVGLTAAFARALGDAQISCNVLAAYHHDHILVPFDRLTDALECLRALSDSGGQSTS